MSGTGSICFLSQLLLPPKEQVSQRLAEGDRGCPAGIAAEFGGGACEQGDIGGAIECGGGV
ncbi:MAG: hypothetical protein AB1507_04370 [Bacillota bacterium]|nr:hypothetical protein [Thermoanaerobacteraceae bacterium]